MPLNARSPNLATAEVDMKDGQFHDYPMPGWIGVCGLIAVGYRFCRPEKGGEELLRQRSSG